MSEQKCCHISSALPRRWVLAGLLSPVLSLILGAGARAGAPVTRPSIVVILADDLGWADVGWHGGEIRTPRLDALAAAGAKLEQFYVQPVCSPTRGALLTGRYPMRYGLQVGVVRPWAQYGLPLEERTLPQALREVGYETAISGKWHLGHVQPEFLPTHRGFEHQYGHYNGAIEILLNTTPAGGAIRVGDWKLVLNGTNGTGEIGDSAAQPRDRPAQTGRVSEELFHLTDDPNEKHNLAAANPEKVKELRERYEALARQAVRPKSAPKAADFRSPRVWGERD
jgi:arylsulfatase A-like enzyme